MKYAWKEVVELVDGEEILDAGEVPFDPPKYKRVEQGTGNGIVVGLNQAGQAGEQTGDCKSTDLIYGMEAEKYEVVDSGFTPLPLEAALVVDNTRTLRERDAEALEEVEEHYREVCAAPVLVDGAVYKGGESSASGISGAVAIAKNLGETDVRIGDVNDELHNMSFEAAMYVAVMIAKVPRDAYITRANARVALR